MCGVGRRVVLMWEGLRRGMLYNLEHCVLSPYSHKLTSGAMYSRVPTRDTALSWLRLSARPKSPSSRRPDASKKMFSGLMRLVRSVLVREL